MKSKALYLSLGLAAFSLSGIPRPAQSSTPDQDFYNQMQSDYQVISNFVNGQFGQSMGFFSTLGWNNPPTVFDLLDGYKFEVSIGAGADLMPISNIHNLKLQALVASANVDIPSQIPAPFPVATARIGLFHGLDFGMRFTYLPLITVPQAGFSGQFNGLGVELRYRILEGTHLPTVTGCVTWDTIHGSLSLATSFNQSSVYQDGGSSYDATVSGNTTYGLGWDVKSFGAKIMVGKQLANLYPFGAIGFQRNSGSVVSTLTAAGTELVQGFTTQNFNFQFRSSGAPPVMEPKFVVGIDVGEGLHWAVVGESNGAQIAASTGFRLQY